MRLPCPHTLLAQEVLALLSEELVQLVNACLCKSAASRPDVISLTRFPFLMTHLQQPVDLRACLHGLRPLLEQDAQAQMAY